MKIKDNIFRVLSLVISLTSFASIVTAYESLSSFSVFDLANIVATLAFILFAIGGSKLLSKLPLTTFLNEEARNIFNTGRHAIR